MYTTTTVYTVGRRWFTLYIVQAVPLIYWLGIVQIYIALVVRAKYIVPALELFLPSNCTLGLIRSENNIPAGSVRGNTVLSKPSIIW